MGLEFLTRVRTSSLWMGGVAALITLTYQGVGEGLGLAAGLVWSLVNLALIQMLVVALTGSRRGTGPATLRAALAAGGMLALFGAGAWLLSMLPPIWLVMGFLGPFAVMVLKATALLIMDSPLWKLLARDPRRSGAVMLGAAVLAWAALAYAGAQQAPETAPAPETAQTLALADPHAKDAAAGHAADPQGHGDPHATDAHGDDHGAAGAHGDDHGGGHGESKGPSKFANVITVLTRAFPDAAWSHWLHEWEVIVFAILFAAAICLLVTTVARNAKMVPGRLQAAVELLFKSLSDFVISVIGEKYGPRFVPFLGTLFIYILVMNYAALIPGLESPTSSLNVTVALAITVFFYAQYIGFKELGVLGWVDHLAGNPRSLVGWLLVPLMLPIHILGEFAKPISLAARLFGNVFGEDMLLVAFCTLGVTVLAFTGLPVGLPLHLPFLFLVMLTGAIQALVFTVLSAIYFLLMLPHDDHGHEHAHEEAVQHAH